ncbi:MAG: transketolase [Clostridiales bacterium]|mgnify:CR=1 FL=1|jgi:transketolase|nr:transketolase [Clostridiales bacterium]
MNYELVSPRDYLGKLLVNLGKKYNNLVVIDSDLASSVRTDEFSRVFPDRFFELGVAEQSAMSVAGGLAIEDFIPFYVNFAIFITGTAWTQLRQICYAGLNVKLIGTHPGLDNGPDGATHHSTADIALARAIPNLVILVPSDIHEVDAAIEEAIRINGPVYIRVARGDVPILHKKECHFDTGKSEIIFDDGDDLAIIFEGSAAKQALEGYFELKKFGYRCKLVNIRSIKPLDEEFIKYIASKVKCIITVENHSVCGGLAGAISEVLNQEKHRPVLRTVGIKDVFTESGNATQLKKKYGLSTEEIITQVKNVL